MLQQALSQNDVTFIISLVAFLFSTVSTVVAYFAGRRDKQRSMRNSLTDILGKIYANRSEFSKFLIDSAGKTDSEGKPAAGLDGLNLVYSQEFMSLLNQAVYVATQMPDMVTSIEFNTLAWAHLQAYEFTKAEDYYKKSIDCAADPLLKSQTMRSYGEFLFFCGRNEDARAQFSRSLAVYTDQSDSSRQVRAAIYMAWAKLEYKFAGDGSKTTGLLNKAAEEIAGIKAEGIRETVEQAFNALIAAPGQADVPTVVPPQTPAPLEPLEPPPQTR
jgi:tetratricopeptide (TPR) repeat protein